MLKIEILFREMTIVSMSMKQDPGKIKQIIRENIFLREVALHMLRGGSIKRGRSSETAF